MNPYPPVRQTKRRIPFYFRENVTKELDRLEHLDIREKVEGEPTHWISPLVIVHKNPGIRICLDSRAVNQAIERKKHPIPTIEDLIVELNGAEVFSKLNLNKGYHQMELDEDSRFITTFQTHQGQIPPTLFWHQECRRNLPEACQRHAARNSRNEEYVR